MKLERLKEPPLFFRFESLVMMIIAIGFWMRLGRRVFSAEFADHQISWVRKMSYPPAYLLQLSACAIVLLICTLLCGTLDVLWSKVGWLRSRSSPPIIFSLFLSLGVMMLSAQ